MRLRIIAGRFGGRFIESTDNNTTHPMGDRVRSALFAKIISRKNMSNTRVLDVFAGTGALGFEALSRGSNNAVFIENDPKALKVIHKNAEILNIEENVDIKKSSVSKWLTQNDSLKDSEKFDLIFIDPPYDKVLKYWPVIEKIMQKACAKNGLVVLSYRSGEALPVPNGVVVVDNPKSYGEASLVFYTVEN